VQIAHGYAKASGKPMVAILHNLVGCCTRTWRSTTAYIDRAPVFIRRRHGADGRDKRRPRIDWIHTAQGQGEAVRHTPNGTTAAHDRWRPRNRSRAPTA